MTRAAVAKAIPSSVLAASFSAVAGVTRLARLHESGALRLRRSRGTSCEGIIVNTGGGIVGGDRLALDLSLAASTGVTITSVAAEKIYRSEGQAAAIETRLTLAVGARLDWLPQETILFDGARLERTLSVEMAEDACFLGAEIVVFGRLAMGEGAIHGLLRDVWRVRRGGRLVFADESRIEGAIGATLDRPGVGGGARAAALVVMVAPDAEDHVDAMRKALERHGPGIEGGVSARDGILVARLLAPAPERLRAATIALLAIVRAAPLPRVWR